MLGRINTFDAKTGCGSVQCDALDISIALCVADIDDAERNLHIGDLLQFECAHNHGRPYITSFVLVARKGSVSRALPAAPYRPVHPAPKMSAAPIGDSASYIDRVACLHCEKYMVPRLVLLHGFPQRSFCPFCAELHRDFTSEQTKTAHTIGQTIGGTVVVEGVAYLLIAGLFGL